MLKNVGSIQKEKKFCTFLHNISREKPVSVLLPSLEEDVKVVVNVKGVPSVVLPVIGDI